jgi:hypothetical protein
MAKNREQQARRNVYTDYEILAGRRVVGKRSGPSGREAALDYLRAMGCKRDEIIYYGVDGVMWRGAIYRARVVEPAGSS